ncbi:hypothetical protein AVEN_235367-1 [Araneus ventricosus]|uniref:Uncharacterized protein n=1 Tax=Araneus ventricosus TaxID=182803 RepID=A0A4Y2A3Q5_ARAVE|nr:hypothetical protein AVEN_235367-1 [Araneus ventricosus]
MIVLLEHYLRIGNVYDDDDFEKSMYSEESNETENIITDLKHEARSQFMLTLYALNAPAACGNKQASLQGDKLRVTSQATKQRKLEDMLHCVCHVIVTWRELIHLTIIRKV